MMNQIKMKRFGVCAMALTLCLALAAAGVAEEIVVIEPDEVYYEIPVEVVVNEESLEMPEMQTQEEQPTFVLPECTIEEAVAEAEITEPVQAEPTAFRVEFVDHEGRLILAQTLQEGEAVQCAANAPVVEGFTFIHWYAAHGAETNAFAFGGPIGEHLVLKAYYIENIVEETEMVEEVETSEDATAEEVIATEEMAADVDEMDLETNTEFESTEDLEGYDVIGSLEESLDGQTIHVIASPEEDIPAAEPEQTEAERSVTITSNVTDGWQEGDVITLHGRLDGFDGCDYALQWEFNDGDAWHPIEGECGDTYSFVATREMAGFGWRLQVAVQEA